jgi:hypothetical protein
MLRICLGQRGNKLQDRENVIMKIFMIGNPQQISLKESNEKG